MWCGICLSCSQMFKQEEKPTECARCGSAMLEMREE